MDARVKPAHDAEYVARSCSIPIHISNSRACAFSRRRCVRALLWSHPKSEGWRNAERRTFNKPRRISRIAGIQRHTATPLGVPPRRLKTLVRSSGDLATLGDFAPH